MCVTSLLFACNSKQIKPSNENFTVTSCAATLIENSGRQDFAFISKPLRTSELSFRISGPVIKFDAFSGNHYKQGSIIAQIDPRDFEIRKNRAEAIYNQAKAEAQRVEILFNKNNISASLYEKAKADYVSAKTAYETAVNELSDTKLTAPFSGYIGTVYIEQYQDVKAAQSVVSMVDISKLKIEAYVAQHIAFNAKKGQKIELYFDSEPNKQYLATIEEVSKSTTQNNLSYLLTAILPNSDATLLAGMSGKIYFDVAPTALQHSVVVPQSVICHRPTVGDYVWIIDSVSSKVHLQKVTTGEFTTLGVTIEDGVKAGDMVASSGLRFLFEGMSVNIAQPQ